MMSTVKMDLFMSFSNVLLLDGGFLAFFITFVSIPVLMTKP